MSSVGRYCIIPGRTENAKRESERRIPRATPAPEVRDEQIPAERCYRYRPSAVKESVPACPMARDAKK